VQHERSRIHLKSERLEVWGRNDGTGADEILREIPIRDTDRLIIAESVQVSCAALAALLRAAIPISVLGWNGEFLGGFLPAAKAHGAARLRQYGKTSDPAFALQLAGRIVSAKIYNQRRVLQRIAAGREGLPIEVAEAGKAMDQLMASAARSGSVDELRGYEGAASARYFQAWASLLPPEFPFERRSTRPPLNPPNACISFAATLVYTELLAFIHAHGLDPALGLLHVPEDGRWSLALDLMEPFRPALIEPLALDVFSHKILSADDFQSRDGGVYMNDKGRKKFILQYERRMERQFMSECAGHRTSLRMQLEKQAVMFKSALETVGAFEPFLMN
jgi:CRISPR-associated protein Cas1